MTELSFLSITGIITSSATFMNVLGAGHGWKIKSSRWWFLGGSYWWDFLSTQNIVILVLKMHPEQQQTRQQFSFMLFRYLKVQCNFFLVWCIFCFVWIDVTSRKAGFKGRYVHVCNAQIVIPTYYYTYYVIYEKMHITFTNNCYNNIQRRYVAAAAVKQKRRLGWIWMNKKTEFEVMTLRICLTTEIRGWTSCLWIVR